MLSLESERAASAIACRSLETILDVVDAGIGARVLYCRNELAVEFAAGHLISPGVKKANYDSVSVCTGGANIDHVVGSFCKYVGVLDDIFWSLLDFVTLQEVESGCEFWYAL